MKSILAVSFAAIAAVSFAVAQDKETEEQIRQATDAAKRMGVKMPDMQKLMEESAKEDAADPAKEEQSQPPASSPAPTSSAAPRVTVDIPAGAAKGSITFDGTTSELKFASAFVDQKDERKPVVLIVSDQKLPTEKWTSEFDMMRDHTKWSGITVFLDREGSIYRTDVHAKGQQSSVSGMFDVKINDPATSDLAGVAKSDSDTKDRQLNVMFHAAHK
jgi:type IV secretory pathway VirB10-like protein